jgi:hypothetical protein
MGDYKVARSRLLRAMAHGERLAQLWNAVPSGRLCTPRVLVGPNGYGHLMATRVGEVPDELPLLLGEMLYQLRSALDACIYQATAYATNQDTPPDEGKLEFPITNDPDEWPKLAKRRLSALPQAIQDGIERAQPYHDQFPSTEELIKSVGRSLGILNELARKDRHRKLHVVGSWPININPYFVLPPGAVVDMLEIMPPSILKEATVIAKFHVTGLAPGALAHVNPQLRTTFGCVEPPPACDPTDTFERRLVEMVNSVAGVIDYFERNL